MSDIDNDPAIIYIGSKPVSIYIITCMTQLSDDNISEIILKARGRAIARAVDVAEVLTKKHLVNKSVIDKISTDTEQLETRDGRISNVSAIEITIKRLE